MLCWCCVDAVLMLYWCCVDAVSFFFVSIFFFFSFVCCVTCWCCVGVVLVLQYTAQSCAVAQFFQLIFAQLHKLECVSAQKCISQLRKLLKLFAQLHNSLFYINHVEIVKKKQKICATAQIICAGSQIIKYSFSASVRLVTCLDAHQLSESQTDMN